MKTLNTQTLPNLVGNHSGAKGPRPHSQETEAFAERGNSSWLSERSTTPKAFALSPAERAGVRAKLISHPNPYSGCGKDQRESSELTEDNANVGGAEVSAWRGRLGLLAAAGIVVVIGVVVLGACALLLPVRWLLDWDVRRERRHASTPPASSSSRCELSTSTLLP